jgi:hypothetical protein
VGATEEPRVLICIAGSGQIMHDGDSLRGRQGRCLAFAGEAGECAFQPSGEVTLAGDRDPLMAEKSSVQQDLRIGDE